MDKKIKKYNEVQEKTAKYARALGHPARIFILDFLLRNSENCCYSGNMAEELPIARSTLSQHLKELKEAGFIQGEINPPYIRYCIDRKAWESARKLFGTFFDR